MMKRLAPDASDEELLQAVEEWVRLLAEERYQDAYDYLYHDERDYIDPQEMKTLISNYGSTEPHWSGEIFKVTLIEDEEDEEGTLDEQTDDSSLGLFRYDEQDSRRGDGLAGYVLYDLPLNGRWSAVSAILNLRMVHNSLVLQLEDIHVL